MARYLCRTCPRCGDYIGIVLTQPSDATTPVRGKCLRCGYELAWAVIQRQVKPLLLALALFSWFACAALAAEPPAKWRFSDGGMRLPDSGATPGIVAVETEVDGKMVPLTLEVLCTKKWGKDARHVSTSMKKRVCAAYGAQTCPSAQLWELDHLVSRELGGADDEKNLWPEPLGQAHIKDRIENLLHKRVCNKQMTLEEAQKGIAEDWTQFLPLLPH